MRTLLIANRGEIALRVMRTARAMGIRTVAIFSDLDADAPHVRAADDAVRVESYLDIDAVVAAAVGVGADAIHPGYGFLSERAEFARAVVAAGIVFVGPSADVMDKMGRKDAAREIAVAAGVPVVPRGEDAGFPVLVKAAAGGGGKGMRIVRSAEEYDDAVAAAKREALSAFGDDTILVEKYVEHGRHIEVQVLADSHGNVIHLYERDCSTQRRHQKVLEEAPAPTIDLGVRRRVTKAAVDLAREVEYVNAGTVEFLLDTDTDEVYFLEMNTRLQVEHPVTEMITGLDLVELQLRVAAGEPLPISQADVTVRGHAIEARVYAEDSFGGFLPQAGTTSIVRWPGLDTLAGARYSTTDGTRVDHALEPGQVVSTSYDPMLGKIVVHGPDREAARRALVAALDDTAILGLTTNVGFLRALAASDEFRDATIDTAWLDTATVEKPDDELPRIFAAWVSAMLTAVQDSGHPFQSDGWRSAGDPAPTIVELDRPVVVDRARSTVDGVAVRQHSAADHVLVLTVDGHRHQAVVNVQPHVAEVSFRGQRFVFERPDVFGDHAAEVGDGAIASPMPGTVLDVRVEAGQAVAAGDVLGVVEAMKMELSLKAPFAGTVTEVHAVAGSQVALGARLFLVEGEED
ncbi:MULTISPECIES: acetyl/propionyl/methylcrotonyl-CoA carboxylase subunit alpha [unclassified Nocardioides]|uniref:acetyl/propionyl/methylcrotonyl-CoA carboxylase subunit alpha n=1 Tax=unclassified Nocardioides TaxID=2615069 RepID=UPI0009EFA100|nr:MULTISPECIES: biotin carboxylase N-terminal domain-containing protein [unclassified Nocardioides]GAW51055.1 carbamoyl-phosphate synthase subunit L [Nocardioides sp. PD653-B2]GAW53992.1 carbamoyl-phosphate synthase subunit L [Nocardioides sp. PD653]